MVRNSLFSSFLQLLRTPWSSRAQRSHENRPDFFCHDIDHFLHYKKLLQSLISFQLFCFLFHKKTLTTTIAINTLKSLVAFPADIKKFRGEVSLMGQDTIENVSQPKKIYSVFLKFHIFLYTSKCATNYWDIFEVYDGFIVQKILKLWRQKSRPFGPNPAQISIPVP